MKPLYYVLISVAALLLILYFVNQNNKSKVIQPTQGAQGKPSESTNSIINFIQQHNPFASRTSLPQIFGPRQTSFSNTVIDTSASRTSSSKATTKTRCWGKSWSDVSGRNYQFEIWAVNCSAPYVADAENMIESGFSKGKIGDTLNLPNVLAMPLSDVVNELLTELNYSFKETAYGLLQFRLAGNEVWGTGAIPHINQVIQPTHPVPPKVVKDPCTDACMAQYNIDIESMSYQAAYDKVNSCLAKCPTIVPIQPVPSTHYFKQSSQPDTLVIANYNLNGPVPVGAISVLINQSAFNSLISSGAISTVPVKDPKYRGLYNLDVKQVYYYNPCNIPTLYQLC